MVAAEAATAVGIGSRDETAAELFAAHYPRLAGWCRHLVDDEDTAHEVAAEAFTRLLSRWSKVDEPRAYLYVTATNLIRDHWRKKDRERRAFQRVGVPRDDDHAAPIDIGLRALVEALPDRMRAAVLLHYYAGFPVREVAAMLERPEGTVKADLHHARARLHAALEDGR